MRRLEGKDAKRRTGRLRLSRSLNRELEERTRKTWRRSWSCSKAQSRRLAEPISGACRGILDKKSKTFSEGSQKELGTLLDPLQDADQGVPRKSRAGTDRLEDRRDQARDLIGTLNGLNQQLSQEAHNLTTALRGSAKAQGDWGEFILRDLLEKAGLREGEQYSFPAELFRAWKTRMAESARTARTDVIVSLPGGRNLVIDSKVSLTAYTDYANAATDGERSHCAETASGQRARPRGRTGQGRISSSAGP